MARALAGQHNADCSAGRSNARRDDPGVCDDRGKQLRRSRGDRRGSRYQGAGPVANPAPLLSRSRFRLRQGHWPQQLRPDRQFTDLLPMSFPTSVEKR